MERFYGTLTISSAALDNRVHYDGQICNCVDSPSCETEERSQSQLSLFSKALDDLSEFDPFCSRKPSSGMVDCLANDNPQISSSSSCADLIDLEAQIHGESHAVQIVDSRSAASPFDQMFREVEERMHRLFERYAKLKSERRTRLRVFHGGYPHEVSVSSSEQLLPESLGIRAKDQSACPQKPLVNDDDCSIPSEYSGSSYDAFPSPKSHDPCKTLTESHASGIEQENWTSRDGNNLQDLLRRTLRMGKEADSQRDRLLKDANQMEENISSTRITSAHTPHSETLGDLCQCERMCSCSAAGSQNTNAIKSKDIATSPIAPLLLNFPGAQNDVSDCERDAISGNEEGGFANQELSHDVNVHDSAKKDDRSVFGESDGSDLDKVISAEKFDANRSLYAGPLMFPPSPVSLQTAFLSHKQLFMRRCQERQMQIRRRHQKRDVLYDGENVHPDSLSTFKTSKTDTNRQHAVQTRSLPVRGDEPRAAPSAKSEHAKPLWARSNVISLKTAREETERRYRAITKPQKDPDAWRREVQGRRIQLAVYSRKIRNRNFYLYGQKVLQCTCQLSRPRNFV